MNLKQVENNETGSIVPLKNETNQIRKVQFASENKQEKKSDKSLNCCSIC